MTQRAKLIAVAIVSGVLLAALALAAAATVRQGQAQDNPGGPTRSESTGGSVEGTPSRSGRRTPRRPPNIIIVSTDDQTVGQFRRRFMPSTFRLLVDRGTSFGNSITTTPLCCPSRATLLSGQYGHNNGVLANNPGYGGLRQKRSTLPAWLQRAGYRTAHVGKYLNRYRESLDRRAEIPPGWDRWNSLINAREYYDYNLSENGRVIHHGSDDDDYLTRVLNDEAVTAIRRLGRLRRPYYLQLDHFAPHNGGRAGTDRGEGCAGLPVPDPRDEGRLAGKPLPRPPSFNRVESRRRAPFIRAKRLDGETVARLRLSSRCALESLRAVDRGIARIDRVLRRSGQRTRTVIVLTSDNGYLRGEHRVTNKLLPYEEALRVPLVMRVPARYLGGNGAVRRVAAPVANIDLAPTILALAGARPCLGPERCRTLDGRSLLGLVAGAGARFPRDRALGIEFDGGRQARTVRPCAYHGVRVGDEVYVRYPSVSGPGRPGCARSAFAEYYDLGSDPFQLDNLHRAAAGTQTAARERQLADLANELRRCAGIEGRDPRRAGRPHCQ